MEEYRRSGNVLLLFTTTTEATFVLNNIVKTLVLNKLDPVCESFSGLSGSTYINIFRIPVSFPVSSRFQSLCFGC